MNDFVGKTQTGGLRIMSCNKLVTLEEKFRPGDVRVKITIGQKILNLFRYGDTDYGRDEIKFKDFEAVYKDWKIERIPEGRSDNIGAFWMFFLCRHSKELEESRKCTRVTSIPMRWNKYTKADVLNRITNNQHYHRR